MGLHWLASLGEIKADFGWLELTLKKGDVVHKIIGDPAMTKSELNFGALMHVLKEEGEGLLIHCEAEQVKLEPVVNIPARISILLTEFGELFHNPTSLPPNRRHDHTIHLKEGVEIPNLRP